MNKVQNIRIGGTWFEITFLAEFRAFGFGLIVAEGSVGFARRNAKQTEFLDVMAPPAGSPEQLAAFYLTERQAAKLLSVGAKIVSPNLPEQWNLCWKNSFGLETSIFKIKL